MILKAIRADVSLVPGHGQERRLKPRLSILDFASQLWRKFEARLAVPKYEARVDGGHSLVVRAQAAQARGPPWV